jgi:hypothetical protein
MRRAAAVAAAAALALSGCATLQAREPNPQPTEGVWAKVRDARTRHAILYDGIIHRATATATFLDPEAREARARRLAEWSSWTQEELRARLAWEAEQASKGEDFVLVFYAADKADNDLDGLKSVWHVTVQDGASERVASRITAADLDATVRALYPWAGPFDVVYEVRFPRGAEPLAGRPFSLVLAGAVGRIALDYGKPAEPFSVPRIGP